MFFFGEGQKRDERTNGQTHIGRWVKNVTNGQTDEHTSYLKKQISVSLSVRPSPYLITVRSSVRHVFNPPALCVFVHLSVRNVFDPRQIKSMHSVRIRLCHYAKF